MDDDVQVLFREEQYFRQPWVWACVLVPMAGCALLIMYYLWAGQLGDLTPRAMRKLIETEVALVLIALWLYRIRLVTEVRSDGLVLHFQWLWRRRWIPFTDIAGYSVVTYNPIRDYGGWGIRYGVAGDKAYNVSGDRGVRLEFTDGGRLLVGSQRPEELARALDLAMRADATPPVRAHGWAADEHE
jgi:hypothetical protein